MQSQETTPDEYFTSTTPPANLKAIAGKVQAFIDLNQKKNKKIVLITSGGTTEVDNNDIKVTKDHKDELRAIIEKYNRAKNESLLLKINFTTVSEYLFLLKEFTLLLDQVKDMAVEHKIQSSGGGLSLVLDQVPKIIKPLVKEWAPSAFTVSFKLETDSTLLVSKSKSALEKYGHQIVIGNMLHTRKHVVWFIGREFEKEVRLTQDEIKHEVEIENYSSVITTSVGQGVPFQPTTTIQSTSTNTPVLQSSTPTTPIVLGIFIPVLLILLAIGGFVYKRSLGQHQDADNLPKEGGVPDQHNHGSRDIPPIVPVDWDNMSTNSSNLSNSAIISGQGSFSTSPNHDIDTSDKVKIVHQNSFPLITGETSLARSATLNSLPVVSRQYQDVLQRSDEKLRVPKVIPSAISLAKLVDIPKPPNNTPVEGVKYEYPVLDISSKLQTWSDSGVNLSPTTNVKGRFLDSLAHAIDLPTVIPEAIVVNRAEVESLNSGVVEENEIDYPRYHTQDTFLETKETLRYSIELENEMLNLQSLSQNNDKTTLPKVKELKIVAEENIKTKLPHGEDVDNFEIAQVLEANEIESSVDEKVVDVERDVHHMDSLLEANYLEENTEEKGHAELAKVETVDNLEMTQNLNYTFDKALTEANILQQPLILNTDNIKVSTIEKTDKSNVILAEEVNSMEMPSDEMVIISESVASNIVNSTEIPAVEELRTIEIPVVEVNTLETTQMKPTLPDISPVEQVHIFKDVNTWTGPEVETVVAMQTSTTELLGTGGKPTVEEADTIESVAAEGEYDEEIRFDEGHMLAADTLVTESTVELVAIEAHEIEEAGPLESAEFESVAAIQIPSEEKEHSEKLSAVQEENTLKERKVKEASGITVIPESKDSTFANGNEFYDIILEMPEILEKADNRFPIITLENIIEDDEHTIDSLQDEILPTPLSTSAEIEVLLQQSFNEFQNETAEEMTIESTPDKLDDIASPISVIKAQERIVELEDIQSQPESPAFEAIDVSLVNDLNSLDVNLTEIDDFTRQEVISVVQEHHTPQSPFLPQLGDKDIQVELLESGRLYHVKEKTESTNLQEVDVSEENSSNRNDSIDEENIQFEEGIVEDLVTESNDTNVDRTVGKLQSHAESEIAEPESVHDVHSNILSAEISDSDNLDIETALGNLKTESQTFSSQVKFENVGLDGTYASENNEEGGSLNLHIESSNLVVSYSNSTSINTEFNNIVDSYALQSQNVSSSDGIAIIDTAYLQSQDFDSPSKDANEIEIVGQFVDDSHWPKSDGGVLDITLIETLDVALDVAESVHLEGMVIVDTGLLDGTGSSKKVETVKVTYPVQDLPTGKIEGVVVNSTTNPDVLVVPDAPTDLKLASTDQKSEELLAKQPFNDATKSTMDNLNGRFDSRNYGLMERSAKVADDTLQPAYVQSGVSEFSEMINQTEDVPLKDQSSPDQLGLELNTDNGHRVLNPVEENKLVHLVLDNDSVLNVDISQSQGSANLMIVPTVKVTPSRADSETTETPPLANPPSHYGNWTAHLEYGDQSDFGNSSIVSEKFLPKISVEIEAWIDAKLKEPFEPVDSPPEYPHISDDDHTSSFVSANSIRDLSAFRHSAESIYERKTIKVKKGLALVETQEPFLEVENPDIYDADTVPSSNNEFAGNSGLADATSSFGTDDGLYFQAKSRNSIELEKQNPVEDQGKTEHQAKTIIDVAPSPETDNLTVVRTRKSCSSDGAQPNRLRQAVVIAPPLDLKDAIQASREAGNFTQKGFELELGFESQENQETDNEANVSLDMPPNMKSTVYSNEKEFPALLNEMQTHMEDKTIDSGLLEDSRITISSEELVGISTAEPGGMNDNDPLNSTEKVSISSDMKKITSSLHENSVQANTLEDLVEWNDIGSVEKELLPKQPPLLDIPSMNEMPGQHQITRLSSFDSFYTANESFISDNQSFYTSREMQSDTMSFYSARHSGSLSVTSDGLSFHTAQGSSETSSNRTNSRLVGLNRLSREVRPPRFAREAPHLRSFASFDSIKRNQRHLIRQSITPSEASEDRSRLSFISLSADETSITIPKELEFHDDMSDVSLSSQQSKVTTKSFDMQQMANGMVTGFISKILKNPFDM
ncbi:hypothetical protein HDV04_002416 [Boothiomyces sp. JEL0838]|nr:hypothetical protein HDV04_002416 [Boothiomyces sp. JEL0838]